MYISLILAHWSDHENRAEDMVEQRIPHLRIYNGKTSIMKISTRNLLAHWSEDRPGDVVEQMVPHLLSNQKL